MIIDRRNFFKLSALASGVVAGAFSSPLVAKEKAEPEMKKSHEHALILKIWVQLVRESGQKILRLGPKSLACPILLIIN